MLGVGVEPPPDSSEPRSYAAMSPPLPTAPRSAWVICPAFSSGDMRESRSATRLRTGNSAFRYGSPCASTTICGVSAGALAPVTVSFSGTVFADAADRTVRVGTSMVREAPDAVPAGKVRVPETGE